MFLKNKVRISVTLNDNMLFANTFTNSYQNIAILIPYLPIIKTKNKCLGFNFISLNCIKQIFQWRRCNQQIQKTVIYRKWCFTHIPLLSKVCNVINYTSWLSSLQHLWKHENINAIYTFWSIYIFQLKIQQTTKSISNVPNLVSRITV